MKVILHVEVSSLLIDREYRFKVLKNILLRYILNLTKLITNKENREDIYTKYNTNIMIINIININNINNIIIKTNKINILKISKITNITVITKITIITGIMKITILLRHSILAQ